MALIKCSECGKEILDKSSKYCIYCGCPNIENKIKYKVKNKEKKKNKPLYLIPLVVILTLVPIIIITGIVIIGIGNDLLESEYKSVENGNSIEEIENNKIAKLISGYVEAVGKQYTINIVDIKTTNEVGIYLIGITAYNNENDNFKDYIFTDTNEESIMSSFANLIKYQAAGNIESKEKSELILKEYNESPSLNSERVSIINTYLKNIN